MSVNFLNFLKLNEDKTEIPIGTDAQREEILSSLGNLAWQIKPEVKNLGGTMDSELNFKSHISNITKMASKTVQESDPTFSWKMLGKFPMPLFSHTWTIVMHFIIIC